MRGPPELARDDARRAPAEVGRANRRAVPPDAALAAVEVGTEVLVGLAELFRLHDLAVSIVIDLRPADPERRHRDPTELGCDDTMGAGVVASNHGTPCGVAAGTRWISSTDPEFAESFECAALIGANSLWQWPMAAMTNAISAQMVGPGGCNEGFFA